MRNTYATEQCCYKDVSRQYYNSPLSFYHKWYIWPCFISVFRESESSSRGSESDATAVPSASAVKSTRFSYLTGGANTERSPSELMRAPSHIPGLGQSLSSQSAPLLASKTTTGDIGTQNALRNSGAAIGVAEGAVGGTGIPERSSERNKRPLTVESPGTLHIYTPPALSLLWRFACSLTKVELFESLHSVNSFTGQKCSIDSI